MLTPTDLRNRGDALNDWICGDGESTFPPPPFTGGQCPTVYLVSLVNSNPGAGGGSTGEVFATGPIRGVEQVPGTLPGTIFVRVLANPDVSFRTGNAGESWSISSLSRLDNQPDNCGDVEPDLPPPGDIVTNVNVTYGPTNNINIVVPVVFAPVYLSIDGTVNVPVTVELFPGFTAKGTLELFPNFDLNLNFPGSGSGDDSQPDPTPPPDDPDGPGEPGQEDPDAPESSEPRVYALLVRGRIESDARPSGIFQERGPDIYAPRLGSARFGTQIGSVTFWTEDIDIKGLDSVVQCPIPWGASRFVVNAAPGVALNYTPVSTAPKDWPPFLQLGSQFTSDNR